MLITIEWGIKIYTKVTKHFQAEQKRNKQLQRKLQSSLTLDNSDDEQECVDEEEYEEEDEVMSKICGMYVEAADPGSSDDDIDFCKVILSSVCPSSKKHAINLIQACKVDCYHSCE